VDYFKASFLFIVLGRFSSLPEDPLFAPLNHLPSNLVVGFDLLTNALSDTERRPVFQGLANNRAGKVETRKGLFLSCLPGLFNISDSEVRKSLMTGVLRVLINGCRPSWILHLTSVSFQ
jgi:hypothetical protein